MHLKELLIKGEIVHYILAILSPFISSIQIYKENAKYVAILNECLSLGMKLVAYKITFDGTTINMGRNIKIDLSI